MGSRCTSGRDRVRPFVESDIPQVAEVHRTVFRVPENAAGGAGNEALRRLSEAYRDYFTDVFLSGPWREEGIGPLVYEEGDGRIAGFLGVVARRMSLGGRSLRVAVCSQFVVHPRKRGMVGLRLMDEHFRGPQDLSFTDEANRASLRLWEARGGEACPLYSLTWIRPLRPGRMALHALRRRRGGGALARACAPLGPVVDGVAARWLQRPNEGPGPRGSTEELSPEALLERMAEAGTRHALHPCYERPSLQWALRRARGAAGDLHAVAVRDPHGRTAGWFVYAVDEAKRGEVLQLVARRGSVGDLFRHLLRHAGPRGVIALTGRSGPGLITELTDRGCLFRSGPMMLLHAKRPEVLEPIHRGNALLTRLEGEWCLRFRP